MPYASTGIGAYRWIPRLTYHADPRIEDVLRRVPRDARIVDLGAGGRRITARTVTVDRFPVGETDLVADVERLPFGDATVDLVFATGLFEHVEDERALAAEIARVLKPGGLVHVEAPFLESFHLDPIDCRRLTVQGLELLMARERIEPLAVGAHIGPTVALADLTARYAALWFEGESRVARACSFAAFAGFSVLFWPLRFADKFLIRKRKAHVLSLGLYFTGRKALPGAPLAGGVGPSPMRAMPAYQNGAVREPSPGRDAGPG